MYTQSCSANACACFPLFLLFGQSIPGKSSFLGFVPLMLFCLLLSFCAACWLHLCFSLYWMFFIHSISEYFPQRCIIPLHSVDLWCYLVRIAIDFFLQAFGTSMTCLKRLAVWLVAVRRLLRLTDHLALLELIHCILWSKNLLPWFDHCLYTACPFLSN